MIWHTNKIFKQQLNTDGDVKTNARKVILWEVVLMIIQELNKRVKFLSSTLISVVGFGSFQMLYKILLLISKRIKLRNFITNGSIN